MLLAVLVVQNNQSGKWKRWLSPLPSAIFLAALATAGVAQTSVQSVPHSQAGTGSAQPVPITLEEAIKRAEVNEPSYATAIADSKVARLDRYIARAGLLPDATFHNQAIYTQPSGLQAGQGAGAQTSQIFIANHAVHEYASQP